MNRENPFRVAHAYMDKHGWGQGHLKTESGEVCLAGALMYTNNGHLPREVWMLAQVCAEQYPGCEIMKTVNVGVLNDHVLQSKEEALALLDKAAVRWDEENS